MNEALLYDVLSWMSPAYPVGAYSHSSGLEWAVEAGLVRDAASTTAWLEDWVREGGAWTDALLLVFAWRAAGDGDGEALCGVADLAAAMATSAERRLETTAQGAAFRRIARACAGTPVLSLLDPVEDQDLAYPVVVGCLMAGHGAPLAVALTAYLHGVVSNLASAAQRLIPLGQTDGQRVIAALRPIVREAAARAEAAEADDPFDAMGSAGFLADLASMAHETQYTRLFRT